MPAQLPLVSLRASGSTWAARVGGADGGGVAATAGRVVVAGEAAAAGDARVAMGVPEALDAAGVAQAERTKVTATATATALGVMR